MGKKRDRKSERTAKYKRAFDEIVGDPYAYPDPIEGHYITLKNSSGVKVAGTDYPTSSSPVNGARPNIIDFFVDVDAAIKDGLDVFGKTWREPDQVEFVFQTTYITEDDAYYQFNQKERAELEQNIGRLLVARHISPTAKYFTTIKQ